MATGVLDALIPSRPRPPFRLEPQQYTNSPASIAHTEPWLSAATWKKRRGVGTATGTALAAAPSTTPCSEAPQHQATPCTSIAHAAPLVTAMEMARNPPLT